MEDLSNEELESIVYALNERQKNLVKKRYQFPGDEHLVFLEKLEAKMQKLIKK